MFKSIPKSNISKRSFNVYKLWNTNEGEYPIIKVYNETGLFDENSDKSEGYFVHTLYNSLKSKYLSTKPNTWIQVHSPDGFMLKEYRFTSAQDAPMRDPANWRVLGSVDEKTWHEIDTVTDFSFSSRGQTAAFVVDNQKNYT